MLNILRNLFSLLHRDPPLSSERRGDLKALLLSELQTSRVNGKPVTHRRLQSLMLTIGSSKRVTMQLLRDIGARPSKKKGGTFWTLKTPANRPSPQPNAPPS